MCIDPGANSADMSSVYSCIQGHSCQGPQTTAWIDQEAFELQEGTARQQATAAACVCLLLVRCQVLTPSSLQASMRDLSSLSSCCQTVVGGYRGMQDSETRMKRWLSGSCRAAWSSSLEASTRDHRPHSVCRPHHTLKLKCILIIAAKCALKRCRLYSSMKVINQHHLALAITNHNSVSPTQNCQILLLALIQSSGPEHTRMLLAYSLRSERAFGLALQMHSQGFQYVTAQACMPFAHASASGASH